jgi:hypothetical protein
MKKTINNKKKIIIMIEPILKENDNRFVIFQLKQDILTCT